MRRQCFQPLGIIVMQAALVVVDEDRSRDVHCVHQAEPFGDSALAHTLFHLAGDVDEGKPGRDVEPQLPAEALHDFLDPRLRVFISARINEKELRIA